MSEFEEYSSVILTRDIEEDGVTYPAGTRGVIVEVRDDGVNYLVEMNDPVFAVITVTVDDLAPVSAD
jgi:hypothetical protein